MDTLTLLQTQITEIMNTSVITVDPKTSLEKVKDILNNNNIHHLPVVNKIGVLEGIISKSDLLLLLDWGTKFNLESSIRKNAFMLKSNLASDIMSKDVVSLNPQDSVQKCLDIFRENYFRAMPVVDSQNKFLGLVTTYDLLIEAFRV
jgi:CBS-domain-containing membrane protein